MVHPAVFEAVNKARGDKAYDPEKWSGYAFGLGMDRLAMILFEIPDIRLSFALKHRTFLRHSLRQIRNEIFRQLVARICRSSKESGRDRRIADSRRH